MRESQGYYTPTLLVLPAAFCFAPSGLSYKWTEGRMASQKTSMDCCTWPQRISVVFFRFSYFTYKSAYFSSGAEGIRTPDLLRAKADT
jgi:hypothetical protein